MGLKVELIGVICGVVVSGIDFKKDLLVECVVELCIYWVQYKVFVFLDQKLID